MNNTLHMKLKSSVSTCLLAAAFVSFSPHISFAGVCFLPDCEEEGTLQGDVDMNVNEDSEYCKKKGYTYYASGECPKYYAKTGTCPRDDLYIKCDAKKWCDDNGYKTTSCSIPQYVNEQCPNGQPVYKNCKTDNARACRELGYTNSCPSGQKLKKNSGRCPYDSSYGTCCKPSGCPAYSSTNSSSYGTAGTDGCEYTCYYTCNINCPSGTSTSNPGGCGGSTKNGCGNKTCYYPYKACCTPSCSNQSGCSCGTYTISDGCGGTCRRCESCHTHSYSCPSGYSTSSSSCSNGYYTAYKECSCGATSSTKCYKCKPSSSSGGGSGGGSGGSTPSNPWHYVRTNCRNLVCWKCLNKEYCGDLYDKGEAPVYTCDMICKNSSTGATKKICELGGWGIFSGKAPTAAECNANIKNQGLKPPSSDWDYGAATCDSSGNHSCSY